MSFNVILLLVVTISTVRSCSDGWTSHDGTCFKFFKEGYSWFNAQIVCNYLGGFLAEDTSPEIHNFLTGMVDTFGTSAWIGAQDFLKEGLFVWATSKQTVATSFWNHGQPNDYHGHEDCVLLSHNGWSDGNCQTDSHGFICQQSLSTEAPVIG